MGLLNWNDQPLRKKLLWVLNPLSKEANIPLSEKETECICDHINQTHHEFMIIKFISENSPLSKENINELKKKIEELSTFTVF